MANEFLDFQTIVTAHLEARRIGRVIGESNSEAQAQFFEGLAESFQEFSKGDKDGAQMLWIGDNVSQRTRDFIRKLAEYICPKGEKDE